MVSQQSNMYPVRQMTVRQRVEIPTPFGKIVLDLNDQEMMRVLGLVKAYTPLIMTLATLWWIWQTVDSGHPVVVIEMLKSV